MPSLTMCTKQEFSLQHWITTSTSTDQQSGMLTANQCTFVTFFPLYIVPLVFSNYTFTDLRFVQLSWINVLYLCSIYALFVLFVCLFQFQTEVQQKCSVYALKSEKGYEYISELQGKVLQTRVTSGFGMPRTRTMRDDDPRRLGLVPPIPPPPTSQLVQIQVSRGLGMYCVHLLTWALSLVCICLIALYFFHRIRCQCANRPPMMTMAISTYIPIPAECWTCKFLFCLYGTVVLVNFECK